MLRNIRSSIDVFDENFVQLSRMLFDSAGVSLVDAPKFCLLRNESECITRFTEPNYEVIFLH